MRATPPKGNGLIGTQTVVALRATKGNPQATGVSREPAGDRSLTGARAAGDRSLTGARAADDEKR